MRERPGGGAFLGGWAGGVADHQGAFERQLRLLNTNSRFHYEAIVEFSEALARKCPLGLDQVLLVNSGSEAVDLAIRIARAATGRSDILALTEAYHGWTVGADAISTSLGDNPQALATRPPWVQLLDAPNTSLLPHVGSASEHTRSAMADLCVDNLVSWFTERRPLTPVPETANVKARG